MTKRPGLSICEKLAGIFSSSSVIYRLTNASNLIVKRAVEREFEIIGEILRRIRDEMPELFERIPSAKDIIGFRNVLSHGYDVVSDNTVYDIANYDLPLFYDTIKRL